VQPLSPYNSTATILPIASTNKPHKPIYPSTITTELPKITAKGINPQAMPLNNQSQPVASNKITEQTKDINIVDCLRQEFQKLYREIGCPLVLSLSYSTHPTNQSVKTLL
jgi:hypothetical protein